MQEEEEVSLPHNSSNSVQDSSINLISDDFSLISPPGGTYLHLKTEWPNSTVLQSNPNVYPLSGDSNLTSENILQSHFALSTAYEKLKRKLAATEKENSILRKQQILDNRMASGSGLPQSYNNGEEINKAWEAYKEKCRECEQIKDELKELQQRQKNSEHSSQIQTLHEEVYREKAKYSDLQQELSSCKGSIEHIGKKELLAREELLKEREYQQNLLAATEKKHHEMQSKIDELEHLLEKETESKVQILRGHKDELQKQADSFANIEDQYKIKIRELEEKNIQLQESLCTKEKFMETKFASINSAAGDNELLEILNEVKNLNMELNMVKETSRKQRIMLQTLLKNPAIESALKSIHKNTAKTMEPNQEFTQMSISSNASSSLSPYSSLSSAGSLRFRTPQVVAVDRFIHNPANEQSVSSHTQPRSSGSGLSLSYQNVPVSSIQDETKTEDLQPVSIPSDEDGDSSMLTLQVGPNEAAQIHEDVSMDENMASSSKPTRPPRNSLGESSVDRPPLYPPRSGIVAHPTSEIRSKSPAKCPVCEQEFMPGATESVMNRHINSHFSDDEEFLQMP